MISTQNDEKTRMSRGRWSQTGLQKFLTWSCLKLLSQNVCGMTPIAPYTASLNRSTSKHSCQRQVGLFNLFYRAGEVDTWGLYIVGETRPYFLHRSGFLNRRRCLHLRLVASHIGRWYKMYIFQQELQGIAGQELSKIAIIAHIRVDN
jgi:hypothetical protein